MPNFEFISSTVPEIWGGSENSKSGSRDPLVTIIDLLCLFFFRYFPSVSICMPNFEFIASTGSEIRRGSQNSEIGSGDPLLTPIDLLFHFLRYFPSGFMCMPNFEFLASTVPEIWRASQDSEIWSRDPLVTPIDLVFLFLPLVHLGVHLRAKFRVTSFNPSRDTDRLPKFQNWVTWPPVNHNDNFSFFSVRSPRGPSACQISSF